MISHKKIEQDTIKYGGKWGYTHTRRLLKLIDLINDNLAKYNEYKKVLLGTGEILVESVATLLRDGFAFGIDYIDEFKEDLKIIDENGDPLVFIEVKGTNRGVKREYINQTDSPTVNALALIQPFLLYW